MTTRDHYSAHFSRSHLLSQEGLTVRSHASLSTLSPMLSSSAQKHKRTFSDFSANTIHDNVPSASLGPGRRPRSYSQTFDLEKECGKDCLKAVGRFPTGKNDYKTRGIREESEEECSESEEVIRKIIQERSDALSLAMLRDGITLVVTSQEEENRRRVSERNQVKQEVLNLVQRQTSENSRMDSMETVVTIKSSQASVTTVMEAAGSENSVRDYSSEETAIPIEEYKSSSSCPVSDESLSEATVIFDSPQYPLTVQNNHRQIKAALNSLVADASRACREEIMSVLQHCEQWLNIVIALKGGRCEIGALYKHDLERCMLLKAHGPPHYPARVEAAQVFACYRYDSGVLRPLQHRGLAISIDAVALR